MAGIVSSGIEAGATTASAAMNAGAVADTNKTNLQIANNANAQTQNLSNTAYQRASADMKAAGINPIMAYSQGGASSPTMAAPTMEAPRPGDAIKSLGGVLNSAQQYNATTKQLQKTEADTELTHTVDALKAAEAAKAHVSAASTKLDYDNKLLDQGVISKERAIRSKQADYDATTQGFDHYTDRAFKFMSNSAKAIGRGKKGAGVEVDTNLTREQLHKKLRDNYYKARRGE